jgi:hypothetical protein
MPAVTDFITTWDGVTRMHQYGILFTPIYGQSFTTPDSTNVVLTTWEWEVKAPIACTFVAYLYQYLPLLSRVTGSALWVSSDIVPVNSSYNIITLSPGIVLDPTKTYAFLYLADNGGSGSGEMGLNGGADYSANGEAMFQNGTDLTAVMNDSFFDPFPMAFRATFNPPTASSDNSLFFGFNA